MALVIMLNERGLPPCSESYGNLQVVAKLPTYLHHHIDISKHKHGR